jgi:hypothetical protein
VGSMNQQNQQQDEEPVFLLPDRPIAAVHVGVDVGQQSDYSAWCAALVYERDTGRRRPVPPGERAPIGPPEVLWETVYHVMALDRVPLGTKYPAVAELLQQKILALHDRLVEELSPGWIHGFAPSEMPPRRLWIDSTGVGRGLVDEIDRVFPTDPRSSSVLPIHPITFTSSDTYDRSSGRMGKRYMVRRLMGLSQRRPTGIDLPKGPPMADAMWEELREYDLKVDLDGHDTYGAMRIGAHDDLATALGLAVLEDPRDGGVEVVPWPF